MTAPSLILLGHGSHDPRCRRSAIRSARVCWRSDRSSTFTSPFSTTARPAACRSSTSWSATGSRRSSSCRCCCRTRSTCRPRCRRCSIRCRRASRSCGSSPRVPSVPRRSCFRSSIGGCVTHCAPGACQSSMGWSSRPPVAAISGAMRWSRGEPGNGRRTTGCPA